MLRRQQAQPRCTSPPRPRTRGARHRSHESARAAHGRTQNDRGYCPRSRACKTTDTRDSPAPQSTAAAPSGSQTRSQRSASGSSAPDQSRAGRCGSSKVKALCAPNRGQEHHRSAGPNDRAEPPRRDQRNKRTGLVRLSAVPSCDAPADDRLINQTESRFVNRLNGSFATQSEQDRTSLFGSRMT
jgi:hypothetical protein